MIGGLTLGGSDHMDNGDRILPSTLITDALTSLFSLEAGIQRIAYYTLVRDLPNFERHFS